MIFENHGRQELPAQDERVESGVVRFEGDWPGLFVRGDDCYQIAIALANLMTWLDRGQRSGALDLHGMQQSVGIVGELQMALGLVIVYTGDKPEPAR